MSKIYWTDRDWAELNKEVAEEAKLRYHQALRTKCLRAWREATKSRSAGQLPHRARSN